MNCYVLCLLLFVQTFFKWTSSTSSNSNNLGDVKNHTKSVYNATKNQDDEESLLKQETHKLLPDCGVQISDNSYESETSYNRRNNRRGYGYNSYESNRKQNSNRRYNNNGDSNENNSYGNYNRHGNHNRRNRYSNYDSDNESSSWNKSNRNDNNRRNRPNNNQNNKSYNNENYSDEEDSDESSQKTFHRNTGMRRFNKTSPSNSYYYNGNNGHNRDYNTDCREENRGYYDDNFGYGYSSFGNNGNMRRGPGFARNFDINLRAKRSNINDEDSQCISQCVFGYLEVLDDNRSPSETLVIKWLQEHILNDMKRIRALREARQCFARLSTSDIEDGCEFSQKLSKCLNLELE